jgi:hypothetical protein
MSKRYTDDQLAVIRYLINRHGHLYYNMGAKLEKEYFSLSGDRRPSGGLYMAAWRMEQGYYKLRGFIIKRPA